MSEQTILAAALNAFANYGIKSVNMSQVSDSIRISKKTLYACYNSKEELICACMDYENENVSRMLEGIERETDNPVKSVVLLTTKVHQFKTSYCLAFYKDIQKYHVAQNKLAEMYQHIQKRFVEYLNEGLEKGLFLSNMNYELIVNSLIEQLMIQSRENFSYQLPMAYTFLRGLCTHRGMCLLNELVPMGDKKYS